MPDWPHPPRRDRNSRRRDAANRTDIEVFFDDLPEPIDLELDLENRVLYWTDRGDPPRGNTVNRASIDASRPDAPEIVVTHLMEGIGIALDVPGNRMFVTDLAGSVYSAKLDGTEKRAQFSLRPRQSHRHRLRRNLNSIEGESTMADNKPIRTSPSSAPACIGASWAALFLAKGLEVVATDVAPDAEAALRRFVEGGLAGARTIGPRARRIASANLTFTADLPEAVKGADLVQENGPERIDFKKKLYRQLDELLPPDVIIASSSSGLTMSEIQSGARCIPERCVIGHPFNPPHLIPLVEIVGGAKTSEETIRRASEFYTCSGKAAVRLHKEMPGHVANRLQAALAREVYYLVAEGVVSAADVDTALCWGPGPALGHHGQVLLNHLGGGQGGIEHFFQQFTGPMTAWWKVLGSPVLTPEVQQKLIDGVHAEVGSRSIDELAAERDEVLLGLLELRANAADGREGLTTTVR